MPEDDEILVSPELSQDFSLFEEFCEENAGQELAYLEVVQRNPLEMDAITLAFCLRHLIRLSRGLMDVLSKTLDGDSTPDLSTILALKGIELDKTRAAGLREVIFAFRDSADEDIRLNFTKALQILTISRERRRVALNLGESYRPPEEGWTEEDFGGDDSLLETVRAVEDPQWKETEEV
ncbi:MAG: hypothetical protein HY913_13340 [Desulfomonile tiedjei]|nr:hypothetical protein [Desulfomonile tiedjei]